MNGFTKLVYYCSIYDATKRENYTKNLFDYNFNRIILFYILISTKLKLLGFWGFGVIVSMIFR